MARFRREWLFASLSAPTFFAFVALQRLQRRRRATLLLAFAVLQPVAFARTSCRRWASATSTRPAPQPSVFLYSLADDSLVACAWPAQLVRGLRHSAWSARCTRKATRRGARRAAWLSRSVTFASPWASGAGPTPSASASPARPRSPPPPTSPGRARQGDAGEIFIIDAGGRCARLATRAANLLEIQSW